MVINSPEDASFALKYLNEHSLSCGDGQNAAGLHSSHPAPESSDYYLHQQPFFHFLTPRFYL